MGLLKKLENIMLSPICKGDSMTINHEVKDKRLKKMLEKKAQELNIPFDRLIWNYINRGLMGDNINEEMFEELHSEEYLKKVDEALGLC